ncbi:MAG TPA: hypothetical protein VMH88_02985 [Gemmatimonadales bacterium]|nr:hypothetical protein [Gemmatimonadales bacterium]
MTDYSALEREYDHEALGHTKPQIIVRDELVAVTDEALALLEAAPNNGLYVRGRLLVQVARSESAERLPWLRRPEGGPVIVPVETDALLDGLDRVACWLRPRRGELVPARPPAWVARQVMARLNWPFPLLAGVVETPTLRPDGTVLETAGYDASTGLLYLPNAEYEPVLALSRAEVADCVQDLLDPVCDFPFVGDSDRGAYVAAVLSLVARYAIPGPVPAFPIVAPVPGAGKGLLARLIALIGTGREPAIMTMPGDEIEFRKRLLVLAIAGTAVVLLDNVSGAIGSDQLAAALTTTEFTDRLLGVSRLVTAPLTATWLLTGNNLRFGRTLGRRMVPIALDPRCEHPEDRTDFRYPDAVAYVKSQRPRLVLAALALIRAHLLAKQPAHGGARMGSFEGWDRWVRSAVVWAGLADPAATDDPTKARGRVRAEADEDLEAFDDLLRALEAAYGAKSFRVADVVSQAAGDPQLAAALQVSASPTKGGAPNAKSIGLTFRNIRDRIIRGRLLSKVDRIGRAGTWWHVSAPDGGMRGEVPEGT